MSRQPVQIGRVLLIFVPLGAEQSTHCVWIPLQNRLTRCLLEFHQLLFVCLQKSFEPVLSALNFHLAKAEDSKWPTYQINNQIKHFIDSLGARSYGL